MVKGKPIKSESEFPEDFVVRTFMGLSGVAIVAIVETARHFLGHSYDLALFPCALITLIVAMAYIKVRVRAHYGDSDR